MKVRRALLYMPATDWNKINKAITLNVDSICMDMEDGTALNRKAEARDTIIRALQELSFGKSEKLDIGPGEFVLEFLESMRIKHTALLGASMGGQIALDFAVEHADMLDGLVLVGAVGVEDYRSRLGAISNKQVLLIWGDSDDVSPKSNYETMIDACPLSKFMNVGHRHACYRDDSVSFNIAVAEFARSIKRQ